MVSEVSYGYSGLTDTVMIDQYSVPVLCGTVAANVRLGYIKIPGNAPNVTSKSGGWGTGTWCLFPQCRSGHVSIRILIAPHAAYNPTRAASRDVILRPLSPADRTWRLSVRPTENLDAPSSRSGSGTCGRTATLMHSICLWQSPANMSTSWSSTTFSAQDTYRRASTSLSRKMYEA